MNVSDNINDVINNSWKRSKNFGIDPENIENDLLTGGELKDRKEHLHELFQSCSPILEQLYKQLKDSLFMVLVADTDGYIVFNRGNTHFSSRAQKVRLDSGANWSESVKGTNAIGTAIMEQKQVSIIGNQHFSLENSFLTCFSSPLYSPTGELLGILDISGEIGQHHPHIMGMVSAAAQACQSQILLQRAEKELTLSFQQNDTIINALGQPLISVDHNGLIQQMNPSASQFLKQPVKQCIGQPLSNWFDANTVDRLLTTNQTKTQIQSESYTWTVDTIFDQRQRTYRSILRSPAKNSESVTKSENIEIWSCPKADSVLKLARNIAKTNTTILIQGETGTGKEMIAKEIHQASGRTGEFIAINCGAIPEHLITSELFGYEKGAFTGANKKGNIGKIQAADKGTLFLDEIGEMPLALQVTLLRFLDHKRVTPVGSNQSQPVDVRILAATNRDLAYTIEEEQFRNDLYYRLCEFKITLPPLRERTDLPLFVDHFLKKISEELNVEQLSTDANAKNSISEYSWPGNIREIQQNLRQAAYQAYFIRESTEITMSDMHLPSQNNSSNKPEASEEEVIAQALQKTKGNISRAAQILNIGRTTLYRRFHRYPHLKDIGKNRSD